MLPLHLHHTHCTTHGGSVGLVVTLSSRCLGLIAPRELPCHSATKAGVHQQDGDATQRPPGPSHGCAGQHAARHGLASHLAALRAAAPYRPLATAGSDSRMLEAEALRKATTASAGPSHRRFLSARATASAVGLLLSLLTLSHPPAPADPAPPERDTQARTRPSERLLGDRRKRLRRLRGVKGGKGAAAGACEQPNKNTLRSSESFASPWDALRRLQAQEGLAGAATARCCVLPAALGGGGGSYRMRARRQAGGARDQLCRRQPMSRHCASSGALCLRKCSAHAHSQAAHGCPALCERQRAALREHTQREAKGIRPSVSSWASSPLSRAYPAAFSLPVRTGSRAETRLPAWQTASAHTSRADEGGALDGPPAASEDPIIVNHPRKVTAARQPHQSESRPSRSKGAPAEPRPKQRAGLVGALPARKSKDKSGSGEGRDGMGKWRG